VEIKRVIDDLENGGITFGWNTVTEKTTLSEIPIKGLGLLITIFAVSLGAPFWFDLLQRFMQVRQAGISPREKGAKERKK
jgi:hypothetical protein